MANAILSEAEREYAARLARELPAVIDLDDLPRWIGMSRATGRPYRSWIFLLEEASRSSSQQEARSFEPAIPRQT